MCIIYFLTEEVHERVLHPGPRHKDPTGAAAAAFKQDRAAAVIFETCARTHPVLLAVMAFTYGLYF